MKNRLRTGLAFLLLASMLLALNSTPAHAGSTPVYLDNYTSSFSNGFSTIVSAVLNHSADVLVVVFVSSRDCCSLMQVTGVSIGDTVATMVPGSLIRVGAVCKNADMCQDELWYAYMTTAGSDVVEVDWAQRAEWMGIIAASFLGADPANPIESVVTNSIPQSNSVSVEVPAGTPHRYIVQFASFDHFFTVDAYGGSAVIYPGDLQNLVTTLTSLTDTIVLAVGPGNLGNPITVTMTNTMLWQPFWETIAFAVRGVGT